MLGKTPCFKKLLYSNWIALIIDHPHISIVLTEMSSCSLALFWSKIWIIFEIFSALQRWSRTAATSKIELFVIIVNGCHKVLHVGCCSSPRPASALMSVVLSRIVVLNYKVSGRVLSLDDLAWYCLLKKSLKILAFSSKFVTSLLVTNKGGMIGAFFQ